jgi:hypothetical protein
MFFFYKLKQSTSPLACRAVGVTAGWCKPEQGKTAAAKGTEHKMRDGGRPTKPLHDGTAR